MCRTEERLIGQSLLSLEKLPPEVKRCHGIDKGEVITGNKVRMYKMAIEGCPYGSLLINKALGRKPLPFDGFGLTRLNDRHNAKIAWIMHGA